MVSGDFLEFGSEISKQEKVILEKIATVLRLDEAD